MAECDERGFICVRCKNWSDGFPHVDSLIRRGKVCDGCYAVIRSDNKW